MLHRFVRPDGPGHAGDVHAGHDPLRLRALLQYLRAVGVRLVGGTS